MFLTEKHMTHNYPHNPNQAGYNLLKFCADARNELYSRLTKPDSSDTQAFESFIMEKIRIRNMDHNELRQALVH